MGQGLSKIEIEKIVDRLAKEIGQSYPAKDSIVLVALGDNALKLSVDLASKIRHENLLVETMHVTSSGNSVSFLKLPREFGSVGLAKGTHVIIVTDIVNEGIEIDAAAHVMEGYYAGSIEICSMFKVKGSKEYINFLGTTIPKGVEPIGYGMGNYNDSIRFVKRR